MGGKKQRCAEQRTRCGARERAAAYRARHAALNYMHVRYNLISGREREEPIVQIHEYEHSDHLVFNVCVCLSTLVLFATPWHDGNPLAGMTEMDKLGMQASGSALETMSSIVDKARSQA